MELADFLQWPILAWTAIVFLAGFAIGKMRSRNEDDLVGPPPNLGRNQRRSRTVPPPKLSGELADWADLDPDIEAAINDALARGQKINAIKILRAATGLGLKESKDAVEARLQGR